MGSYIPFNEKKNVSFLNKKKENADLAIHNEETCYFLLWELSNTHLPTEKNTRIKFGFNKCESRIQEIYLYHVYYDYFFNIHPTILFPKKVYNLHQAYLIDKLYEYICSIYEHYDQDTNYFKWFKDNPQITKQSAFDFLSDDIE